MRGSKVFAQKGPSSGDAHCCHIKPWLNGNIAARGGGNYNRSGCDPPPSYLSELAGSAGGRGVGGIGSSAGARGCARPTTTTCIPLGCVCVCVFGAMGVQRYVCVNSDFSPLPGRKS